MSENLIKTRILNGKSREIFDLFSGRNRNLPDNVDWCLCYLIYDRKNRNFSYEKTDGQARLFPKKKKNFLVNKDYLPRV